MALKPIIANKNTKLSKIDPGSNCGYLGDKDDTIQDLTELVAKLAKLQNVMYAENKHRVLVVLQAMDTGGKDGLIRKVFSGVNPQGVRVVNFKAPTPDELEHDYLWRVHQHTPPKGDIFVFNRSHYEDVLITLVHGWIDKAKAERRYRHINEFERMLVDEGVTLLKFFLYISKDEQKRRLQDRLDDPAKRWKFNVGDLDERKHWDNYMSAYQQALRATSTKHAPWHIVPANKKWIRDVYVASVLADTMKSLKMSYPPEDPALATIKVK